MPYSIAIEADFVNLSVEIINKNSFFPTLIAYTPCLKKTVPVLFFE